MYMINLLNNKALLFIVLFYKVNLNGYIQINDYITNKYYMLLFLKYYYFIKYTILSYKWSVNHKYIN